MNTEDGAKLYDICPHVSDSVRECYQAGFSEGGSPLQLIWLHRKGDFPAESLELTQAKQRGSPEEGRVYTRLSRNLG